MSTIISQKSKNFMKILENPQVIIVKGFRGEPAMLKCVGIEKFHFIILGNNEKTEIKLKKEYVYNYDKKTYDKLKKLFEAGDSDLLSKEWEQLKHYDIPESEG